VPNVQRLVVGVLQPVRDRIGRTLSIISGYRTPGWNSGRGVSGSTHLEAAGADIRAGDPAWLHDLILRLYFEDELPGLGGLGRYPGWVHVDIRKAPDGHLRRWTGGGVGSEPKD
jgi:uncharacterized protein YcbK (DUF882 family)